LGLRQNKCFVRNYDTGEISFSFKVTSCAAPLLASWNFKHIVSINPIRKIHEINSKEKYQIVEIGSLEIYGGAKYGNL